MRRVLAAVLSVLAILVLVAPDAFAQAPAAPTTKVTISGLIDNVTSYTRNLSVADVNVNRADDVEWYSRQRARPDITAELGSTKYVLGLEIDAAFGQTGATDNTAQNRSGTTGSYDQNTDVAAIIEIKWSYVEFNMPGMPWTTRVRLGAQPYAVTYKGGIFASGDFAGVHLTSTLTPALKFNFTGAQLEESSTGRQDGFRRGEDYALFFSLDITPFKGLELKPLYSYFKADGATAGNARQGRGGLAAASFSRKMVERRHTIGADARWTAGPFTFDPTFLFQWGERDIPDPILAAAVTGGNFGRIREQDMHSWLLDLRGGFRTGPLLLEGAFIWTPGNSANEDVRTGGTDVKYFQPIDTDTGFYSTWAEHWALGIDYFTILNSGAAGLNPGVAIGYDKYGLIRLGARASYAVTPAFTARAALTANWTDEKVDTHSTLVGGATSAGLTPNVAAPRGDASYLGTELDLGFQWRFAPGLALDVVGAYTWNGAAMKHGTTTRTGSTTRTGGDPEDSQSAVARLRYTF